MKLKTIALLSLVLTFSTAALAQTAATGKPQPARKPAGNKPAPAAKLPTAKKILDKYVAAIGGRAAHKKIKTRVTKAAFEFAPMGIKGTSEIYAAAPDKSYSKMNMQGIGEILTGTDGKTAWSINPIQGSRDITGEELLQLKLVNNLARDVNLDKLYTNWTVKGIEAVAGKDAYVLVGTPAGLQPETFYFDKQSGLLVQSEGIMVSPEGKMPAKLFYEDYRKIDGVKIPYKTRIVIPQAEINTTITEIKHGAAVEEAKFAKPKQ